MNKAFRAELRKLCEDTLKNRTEFIDKFTETFTPELCLKTMKEIDKQKSLASTYQGKFFKTQKWVRGGESFV